MTHSKLRIAHVLGALLGAMSASGCAMEAGEPAVLESTLSEELRVAPAVAEPAGGATDGTTNVLDVNVAAKKPALLRPLVITDHVLSGSGGIVDDGPRPHPWAPPPEEAGGGTTTGTSSGDNSNK